MADIGWAMQESPSTSVCMPLRERAMSNDLPANPPARKMNVGCGRNSIAGWINVDSAKLPGVDILADLEDVRRYPIALPDNSIDHFLLSHVLEHINNSLNLMEELWRLAVPGATAEIRLPHGGSDDAWEDPTHVRPYFLDSFGYFSQPFYARADYGYRGDWKPERILLKVDSRRCENLSIQEVFTKSRYERNLVREMICEMRAIKPRREPRRELQTVPQLEIKLV
jgi:SAM-dependent methyltransferase